MENKIFVHSSKDALRTHMRAVLFLHHMATVSFVSNCLRNEKQENDAICNYADFKLQPSVKSIC